MNDESVQYDLDALEDEYYGGTADYDADEIGLDEGAEDVALGAEETDEGAEEVEDDEADDDAMTNEECETSGEAV